MPKKMKKEGDPEIHKDLDGFDISVNEFGEIVGSTKIDDLNEFLDEKVKDNKLSEEE